jgi:signal transduction histidine kinase
VDGGDHLLISVADDGIGFNAAEMERNYDERGSLGILNMKERARFLEGMLTITSHSGQGTLVSLRLPLAPNLASEKSSRRQ